jgi:hypothetical protein
MCRVLWWLLTDVELTDSIIRANGLFIDLTMRVVNSSETSVNIRQITLYNIPEDSHFTGLLIRRESELLQ